MPLRWPRRREKKENRANIRLIGKVVKRIAEKYKKTKNPSKISTLRDSIFAIDRPYMPSGVLPVDCVVAFGMGFPTGIIEIFGPETSGKTALVEKTLAEAQRLGYHTGMFAAEYTLNYRRVRRVGLDDKLLIMFDAETIEDFYTELVDVVGEIRKLDKKTPIVIGWDTIAATPTNMEQENERGLDYSAMGQMAGQMSKFFKRLVRFLFVNKVCLLCVNQTRVNLAQMWGSKETTSGGKALRFYAWVRCRVSRIKGIVNSEKREIGFLCEFRTVKNKVAPPFRRCTFPIYWDRGIDSVMAIWHFGIEQKVFKKKGAHYTYKGHKIRERTFPEFYKVYHKSINQRIRESVMRED